VPLAGAGQDLVEAAAFLAASEQALHGANLLPRRGPMPPQHSTRHVVGGPADYVPHVMPGSRLVDEHWTTKATGGRPGGQSPGRPDGR